MDWELIQGKYFQRNSTKIIKLHEGLKSQDRLCGKLITTQKISPYFAQDCAEGSALWELGDEQIQWNNSEAYLS